MLNTVDAEDVDELTVTSILLVSLSSLLLKDDNLLCLGLLFYCRVDTSILNCWPSDCCIVWSTYQEDVVKADLLSNLKRNLLDLNSIILHYFVLSGFQPNNSEDLFGMCWNRDTSLLVMNVYDGILLLDRFLFSFSELSLFSFSLLFL